LLNKVNVYASIFRFEGQVAVFNYLNSKGERGPNYRDLFPEPPPPNLVPDCATSTRTLKIKKQPSIVISELIDYEIFCGIKEESPAGYQELSPTDFYKLQKNSSSFSLIELLFIAKADKGAEERLTKFWNTEKQLNYIISPEVYLPIAKFIHLDQLILLSHS